MSFTAALAVMLPGCDADIVLLEPDRDPAGDLTTLEVRVTDPDLAGRVGWTPGAGVAGATLQVRREGTIDVHSYVTDEDGVLELRLPSALYWVWAERRIDTQGAGAPAVLAGGFFKGLSRGSTSTVEVRGHERGSLVVSELYYHGIDARFIENYFNHPYVEVRNDADSIIYLDGKIIGTGFDYSVDSPAFPCAESAPYRNEPRGIWARIFQQFPGGGGEYPLPPGEVVVIAEQAIDHSTLHPVLPDLSHADFQFHHDDGRAVNPDVPTMLPVGLVLAEKNMGALQHVAFIAERVDVDALERAHNPAGTYVLIPRERILDLSQIISQTYFVPRYSGVCGNLVDLSLNALAAFASPHATVLSESHFLAAQRKVLPDGALQRTGVSVADWEIRERSPGRIP